MLLLILCKNASVTVEELGLGSWLHMVYSRMFSRFKKKEKKCATYLSDGISEGGFLQQQEHMLKIV